MKTAHILRELRLARNLSQSETAKALGIDRTTYVKYEHGGSIKRNLPKLADFFQVSTDYLLGRIQDNAYDKQTAEGFDIDCDGSSTYDITITPLPAHESDLMQKYRLLKPEHKKAVDIQIDYFHSIDT